MKRITSTKQLPGKRVTVNGKTTLYLDHKTFSEPIVPLKRWSDAGVKTKKK